MPVILTGKYDTGKSTILKLLLSKIKSLTLSKSNSKLN